MPVFWLICRCWKLEFSTISIFFPIERIRPQNSRFLWKTCFLLKTMLKDCWKVEKIGGKMAKICGSSFLNYSFHWFLIFEFNIWYLIFDYGYFCYAFLMAKNKFAINRTGFKNFFFVWAFNRAFCAYFLHCNVVLMIFAKILLNFLCFFWN